jgi:hypothetical protein
MNNKMKTINRQILNNIKHKKNILEKKNFVTKKM